MKGIKTVNRGNDGTYLEFTNKNGKSLLGYKEDKFILESEVSTPSGVLVEEAPINGTSYARKDGDWIDIPTAESLKGKVFTDNTITVHPTDASAAFNTIKDALDSIIDSSSTNRYTVLVGPGNYIEDNNAGPIDIPAFVSIQATGTRNAVISGLVPSNHIFTVSGTSTFVYITGLIFTGLSGTSYAINNTSSGSLNVWDCVIRDCANGILQSGTGSTEVKRFAINNPASSTTTYGIRATSGLLGMDDITSRSTSNVTTVVDVSNLGTVSKLVNFTCISPNVGTSIKVYNGGSMSAAVLNIQFPTDGVVVYGNDTEIEIGEAKIFNSQTDGFRIEGTGTDIIVSLFAGIVLNSGNLNFNVLNPNCTVTGSGYTQLNKGYVIEGARFYAYLLDITEDDEGLNILGELHVGTPERGAESVFGEGDSYTRGMLTYTYNPTGAVWEDVTTAASTASGSTFGFSNTITDSAIYIASTLLSSGDYLKFWGLKTKLSSAAVKGSGSIVFEYWNGASWEEVDGMEVESSGSYLPHANDYFNHSGSHHIRLNSQLHTSTWTKNDPMSLGTSYYWIRARIATAITTSPAIEQFKLHTSRFEINSDGWTEYFGTARPIGQLGLDLASGEPFEGNMQSRTLYINENLGVGHSQNRFTATSDKLGKSGFLPYDCDTSSPIRLIWSGYSAAAGTLTWTIRWGWVTDGDPLYAAEPGLQPGLKTDTVTKTVSVGINEVFAIDLDIKEMLSRRAGAFGDELWISIQPTTLPSTFSLSNSQAVYTKWCDGGHIV